MKTTTQQETAIQAQHRVLICLAGPGSGKTATMTRRIERDVKILGKRGIHVITYTNTAANEMRHRLHKLGIMTGYQSSVEYIGTLHGLALRLIRKHPDRYFGGKAPTVLSEAAREHRILEAMQDGRGKGLTMADVETAIAANPVAFPKRVTARADFPAIHYLAGCQRDGVIDFDSMVSWATAICWHEGVEIPVLYVDESQDLSGADHAFITALLPKELFLVGDPDQSIFGFRGARPDLMMQYGGRTLEPLTLNFRCSRAACRAANAVIELAARRPVQKLTEAAPGANEGELLLLRHEDQSDERRQIAEWAQEVGHHGAILCRTNWEVKQVSDFLQAAGVEAKTYLTEEADVEGWDAAVSVVSLLTQPDNESVAAELACRINPSGLVPVAAAAKLKGMTLSQYLVGSGKPFWTLVDPLRLTSALRTCKVPAPACQRLADLIPLLPPEAQWQDLLAEMPAAGFESLKKAEFGDEAGVSIMTIHRAKGMEWDDVWLPGWAASSFPSPRSDPDEEVRLAFVAVTRARGSVIISAPATGVWSERGKLTESEPGSIFVALQNHVELQP